jgi:hypothetical protein
MRGDEFEAILRDRWNDLLRNYHLSTFPGGENRAYISGHNLLLQVLATRDGIDISYVDLSRPNLPLYSINSLLLRSRRDRLVLLPQTPRNTSFYNYVEIQLDILAGHLSRAAGDVLRGEHGWMQEHGPSHLDAGPDIRAFLDAPHTFHPVES